MRNDMKTNSTANEGLKGRSWLRLLVSGIAERCPTCCYTKWWQGRAYYEARTDSFVMVVYPFHWLVNLAWWLNLKWSRHRQKPSWIDRQVNAQS